MSICAGYFSSLSRIESQRVEEVSKNFSVLKPDSADTEVVRIIPTKHGHQICRYNVNAPSFPLMAEDLRGNFLMLLGFIHREDFKDNKEIGPSLLQSIVHEGAAVLEQQEGQFVAVLVEGETGIVHIVNDRFASRPLYWMQTNKGTFYSSNLTFLFKLASVTPTPDPLGWLQIFRFAHTLGKTTNCTGAQRLQPGTHLTITPDRVVDKTYWKLEHRPENDLDPGSFADEVFEAFQASAAWRARRSPRSIIALSGGLDSRLVASSIPRDLDLTAFTFVNSVESTNTAEVSTAAEVARRLGLKHEIKRVELGACSATADSVVRLTDGLVTLQHPTKTMQYIGRLGKECNYLLGGAAGGVLAGGFVPDGRYLDRNLTGELVASSVNRGLGRDHLALIFGKDFLDEWLPKLDGSIMESFGDVTGPTAAHRVTAWTMTVRQPAFTFTSPFHNHPQLAEGIAHLGYRYSDLMLKLPADWLLFKNFYGYMIHRCIPELRDVVYANTGKLLNGRLLEFDYASTKSLRSESRFKSKLKRFSLARRMRDMQLRLFRNYGFEYALMARDAVLLKSVEDLLDLSAVTDIVDIQRCRKFLQGVRKLRPQSTHDSALLGSLATLCFYTKNVHAH